MTRWAPLGILLACTALLVAGCSAPLPRSGPVAVYPQPEAGMDALLVGTLRLVDGCVVVEPAEGEVAVPIFPVDDVAWDDATETLTFQDEAFHVGDEVSLGGGSVGTVDPETAYLPDGCEGRDLFLVSPY